MPMTLREYAQKCGVSYEAVRKQVRRCTDALQGHLHQQGRVQVLDDWAVDYLDSKRQGNPVVVAQTDLQEHVKALEAENKTLLVKVAAQADELSGVYKQLAEAQNNALLLPEAQQEAQNARKAAQEARREAERLKEALEAERSKTWLQRLLGR